MLLSLNWLKDFIDIPNNITPEKLGEILTLHTVEVEEIKNVGANLDKIVVGKIIIIDKHPNADKLKLATVDLGNEKKKVVCGGINLREGMLVAFAKVGAKVKWHGQGDSVELASAVIRGEKSEGMICAASEVGLEDLFPAKDEREVIDLIPSNSPLAMGRIEVGQNLAEALGLDDVIYDIDNKSMTHRPDLWGIYGMARDLAAVLGIKLRKYNANPQIPRTWDVNAAKTPTRIKISVEDRKLCPRYMAAAIEGVKIKPSPAYMQKRLVACGMRPINNIVDITNYVMLELGQPTHAFDVSLIFTNFQTNKHEIIVRRSKQGEKLTTLDGQERKLDNEMLLITNGNEPLAIAGVMGGGNSEIDDATTDIILEAANFDAVSVRKTSQKLGLRTEASQRFEKSLDPNLCETAVDRIAALIKESCPEAKVAAVSDVSNFKLNTKFIKLDLAWLNKKMGAALPKQKAVKILKDLGFEASPSIALLSKERGRKGEVLNVKAPSWRATKDINIPEDLAEEVARVYGYDNIEPVMPQVLMRAPEINEEREFENKVRDILVRAGLSESYNYSFTSEKQLRKLDIEAGNYIKLANPLTNEHTLLRRTLHPLLLENVVANQRQVEVIKIFEIGSVFWNKAGGINKSGRDEESLPYQQPMLACVYAANVRDTFSNIKGVIEYLFKLLGVEDINYMLSKDIKWPRAGIESRVEAGGELLGYIFILDNSVAKTIGLKVNVAVCELDLVKLFAVSRRGVIKYRPKNKFPHLRRDMAFVFDEKILYNKIKVEVLAADRLIKDVEVFDVYQGEKLGRGKKNIAMRITFGSPEKTLIGEEVDEVQNKIVKVLKGKFNASLRDF